MRTSLILCAVLAFVGCKKEGGDKAAMPAELVPQAAVVDTSKLKAPELFSYIPSDTPYVIGSFEAFPLDYWRKMKKAFAPMMQNAFSRRSRYGGSGDSNPVLDAVMAELDGKWDAKGLESLGL